MLQYQNVRLGFNAAGGERRTYAENRWAVASRAGGARGDIAFILATFGFGGAEGYFGFEVGWMILACWLVVHVDIGGNPFVPVD